MNPNTYRGLLLTGLCANVLLLMLALLDYSVWRNTYAWPIFTGWAFVILLMAILAVAAGALQLPGTIPVREVVAAAPSPVPPRAEPSQPMVVRVVPKGSAGAPFTFNGYTLHTRIVELKNGGKRPIYFFAKSKPKSGHAIPKPAGFHVGVNERTGLPFLKRGTGPDGEDLTPEQEPAYRPQCSALTDEGAQCRNSARSESKYCASHFGYQPPAIAKAEAKREDTRPRVPQARDTLPSVRRRVAA